jgi:hypothetical protein
LEKDMPQNTGYQPETHITQGNITAYNSELSTDTKWDSSASTDTSYALDRWSSMTSRYKNVFSLSIHSA